MDPASFGRWYRDIGGGMGAALNAAAAMDAYTLSDRGTWLSFNNKGDLAILVEGATALLNRYSVIVPNPAEHRPEGASRPSASRTGCCRQKGRRRSATTASPGRRCSIRGGPDAGVS